MVNIRRGIVLGPMVITGGIGLQHNIATNAAMLG
jgi:hypothetical protein